MALGPHTVVPGTPRTRLARLALDAARSVDDVLTGDPGPRGLLVTGEGPTALLGVRAIAEPGGGYAVDLGLQARLVPLEALADRVRAAVAERARREGLGSELGPVSVTFHDVVDPDAAAAAALADALVGPTPPEAPG